MTFLRNQKIRQATGTELRSFLRQVIVSVQKKKESSSAAVPSRVIDEAMLLLAAFDDSKTAAVATEESCATGSGDVLRRLRGCGSDHISLYGAMQITRMCICTQWVLDVLVMMEMTLVMHTLTVIIAIVVMGRSVAMVMLVEFSLILVVLVDLPP